MQTNILEYLEKTAVRRPDKCAYSTGDESMTFSEVIASAKSVGSFLSENGYYREGVAILMDKHPRTVATFWGVIYSGSFYVPLDAEMPKQRIELIFDSLKPRVLICDDKNYEKAKELGFDGKILKYGDIASFPINAADLDAVREKQLDTDPIYVVFTSGSTGMPKGVVACHRSVIDYTESISDALGFSENNVFANQTPLYFDAPLKELMPGLKFGATVYFVPKKHFMFPINLVKYLNEHKINTVCWVVSALTMISSLGVLEKCKPEYLTTVAFGSEVFPPKQYDLWRKALPDATFYNLYGPTEATGMSCYWRADRELGDGEAIPIGRPFRNTEIMLIGEDGRRVPDGETGEIYIRGTCVTLGYFNNPEKTGEAFVQNPLNSAYPETVYRTGDLGKVNQHGELVYVCRKDLQIKHMGHRIELGEIEAAATANASVSRAVCLYDGEGKKIVLVYSGVTDEASLLAALRTALPKYMIPGEIIKLDSLPLTPNGKVDRRGLNEKFITEREK